jgi:transposase
VALGRAGVQTVELEEAPMTILMGLDQHRAQITADWLDTATGEVSRARVTPGHRAAVRQFVGRFAGQELEVALEATTGWRFVVEELHAVGARVHLAEPAETSALRGSKERAKSDRADARHLRELLMAGRLPESWIPPDYILDLRARVRLRHTLSEQRGEWQQRIQSVLYHHGCRQRGDLMNRDGLAWLAAQPLTSLARDQVRIALQMIDALDSQIAPLDKELRAYARRQPGCKALTAHYGIGPITSVTILAELGDPNRFSSSREAVRYAGLEMLASNCTSSSGDFGLRDVAGVRDPLAAFLLDLRVERDPQAVGAVAARDELVVRDPVVDHAERDAEALGDLVDGQPVVVEQWRCGGDVVGAADVTHGVVVEREALAGP